MNVQVAMHGDDVLTSLGTVEQAMSRDFGVVSPDTSVGEALVLIEGKGAGTGLVVEEGKLVGVVTLRDLMDVRTLASSTGTLWGPGRSQAGWRVSDVMTPSRRAVSPVTPLARAVCTMYEDDLERVAVADDDWQLVGVLSRRDVIRAVARR
jgi:CBS domain-containing protein